MSLDQLVQDVMDGAKYRFINPDLVYQIAATELAKDRPYRETVKAARNKLHQIGGAFQEGGIDYAKLTRSLQTLPPALAQPALQQWCLAAMKEHASTRERLPILKEFYATIFSRLGPVHSVLDLACGLNPLALPWIPLEQGASYYACDIYQNMVDFINLFFAHTGQPGKAENVNLQDKVPAQKVQLAFLLKTLPCLEQLDKHISRRLLDSINAEHMLITYPAQSLGGQSKGMPATYTAQFQQLAQDRDWQVESFQFPGEIAFLVHRTSL